MKHHSSTHQKGFTLIELLVVIAIIAVLAGAGFQAGLAALQRAKRVKALSVATALEQAVNNFYSDYGYLPAEGAADTVFDTDDSIGGAGNDLLIVLAGKEPAGDQLNPKSNNYLSLPEGKGNKDGIIYEDNGTIVGIYDPWGGPYHIMLDLGYDEQLEPQPKAVTNPRVLNNRRVAVWTDGADGVKDAVVGKAQDDVATW